MAPRRRQRPTSSRHVLRVPPYAAVPGLRPRQSTRRIMWFVPANVADAAARHLLTGTPRPGPLERWHFGILRLRNPGISELWPLGATAPPCDVLRPPVPADYFRRRPRAFGGFIVVVWTNAASCPVPERGTTPLRRVNRRRSPNPDVRTRHQRECHVGAVLGRTTPCHMTETLPAERPPTRARPTRRPRLRPRQMHR